MMTLGQVQSREKELEALSRRVIRTLDPALDERVHAEMRRALEAAFSASIVHRKGRRLIQLRKRSGDVLTWAVGQRIKSARERRGWLQEDLADESGIARANIARLEGGRHSARLSTLRRVAKALDLSIDELVKAPEPFSPRKNRELAEADIRGWTAQLDEEDNA